ncbi:uncharacterized protein LOC113518876 [Galleria mellonella]|uniref:Uncharacterized protein LOC113518876 n=1 Tax=Galleria mellonella TaxID=7137 RepID=A0A6J1WUU3_GALME|nr:uncharacterized protein LOC113518876 [Galleria mellonella]XP_052758169.1 uncharacterized protein LOC113518876 [Galleria mellonella]
MACWTNDAVLEFLNLYRREQHLWDPKHPLHRNRSEVANAWLRIQSSLSMNYSVVDLKKKKESLMTSFRMHFNKKKRSPEAFHTTWFAYPLMESFLGGKYECDSTNQNMEHEFYNNVSTYTPNVNVQQPIIDVNSRSMPVTERTNLGSRQNKPQTSTPTTKTPNTAGLVFVKKQEDEEAGTLRNAGDERTDMDEYDLYGQLLAKKLRKLDEHQRDVVMHDIDNIMFRAKMQSGSSQTRSYSSSPSPVPRKVKSPIFIVAQQSHTQYEDENTPYQDHMQPQPPS